MAGASMKDIKLRIRSVESTMQITKAMELVASSKLRKAKERQECSRPYFTEMRSTLALLENLHDALALSQTCLGVSIQIAAELSKALQLAILGIDQLQAARDLLHRLDLRIAAN